MITTNTENTKWAGTYGSTGAADSTINSWTLSTNISHLMTAEPTSKKICNSTEYESSDGECTSLSDMSDDDAITDFLDGEMNGGNDMILDIIIYGAIAIVVAFGSIIIVPLALITFFFCMIAYFVLFFLLAWLPFVIIGLTIVVLSVAFGYVYAMEM